MAIFPILLNDFVSLDYWLLEAGILSNLVPILDDHFKISIQNLKMFSDLNLKIWMILKV